MPVLMTSPHLRWGVQTRYGAGGSLVSLPRAAPNKALEPTASSFGYAPLRLRFRRRLTAGVRQPGIRAC